MCTFILTTFIFCLLHVAFTCAFPDLPSFSSSLVLSTCYQHLKEFIIPSCQLLSLLIPLLSLLPFYCQFPAPCWVLHAISRKPRLFSLKTPSDPLPSFCWLVECSYPALHLHYSHPSRIIHNAITGSVLSTSTISFYQACERQGSLRGNLQAGTASIRSLDPKWLTNSLRICYHYHQKTISAL